MSNFHGLIFSTFSGWYKMSRAKVARFQPEKIRAVNAVFSFSERKSSSESVPRCFFHCEKISHSVRKLKKLPKKNRIHPLKKSNKVPLKDESHPLKFAEKQNFELQTSTLKRKKKRSAPGPLGDF